MEITQNHIRQIIYPIALLTGLCGNPAQAASYELIQLDLAFTNPMHINDVGQMTGTVYNPNTSDNFEAFYYDNNGLVYIEPAGSPYSDGNALNNSGQVVGLYVIDPGANTRAFLYDNGITTDIGNLGPAFDTSTSASANGINENGDIVGFSGIAPGLSSDSHAFFYSNGSMQDLGTLGGTNSYATDINENGQIVGSSDTASGDSHAFLYENGVMHDLGTLGGDSSAVEINNHGQVVGTYIDANGDYFSFFYENGVMQDMGNLGGDKTIVAAINDAGQAVGSSNAGLFGTSAFLYENGVMIELCALVDCTADGWDLWAAYDINENGDIVGIGLIDGQLQGFMMRAVPVPAAVYLFVSGLFLLTGLGRLKKQAL